MKVNRVTIQKNNFLILDNEDTDSESIFPLFLNIHEIIKLSDKYFFYGCLYETNNFNEILNAYEIEKTDSMKFLNINDFFLFKPVNAWYAWNFPDKAFICRKEYY